MNNHVNQCRLIFAEIKRTQFTNECSKVEFDHMPVEVATEMLCAPKARITARERKECFRARETRYSSLRVAKPMPVKLENRFSRARFSQLVRWNRRAANRRRDAQCQYQSLAKQLDKLVRTEYSPLRQLAGAMAKRKQAELDLAAAHFDLIAELTNAEIQKRICH